MGFRGIEQEAGVQGAGCKGERVSLAQKSPAAMPWSETEQGLQSPTSLSCLHSVGVQSPSVCPPAPPSPAPLPLFERVKGVEHTTVIYWLKRKQRRFNFGQFPRSPRHAKNIPTKNVKMSNN